MATIEQAFGGDVYNNCVGGEAVIHLVHQFPLPLGLDGREFGQRPPHQGCGTCRGPGASGRGVGLVGAWEPRDARTRGLKLAVLTCLLLLCSGHVRKLRPQPGQSTSQESGIGGWQWMEGAEHKGQHNLSALHSHLP